MQSAIIFLFLYAIGISFFIGFVFGYYYDDIKKRKRIRTERKVHSKYVSNIDTQRHFKVIEHQLQ